MKTSYLKAETAFYTTNTGSRLCSRLIGVSVNTSWIYNACSNLMSPAPTSASDLGWIWMGGTTNTVTFEQAVEIKPVLTYQSVGGQIWNGSDCLGAVETREMRGSWSIMCDEQRDRVCPASHPSIHHSTCLHVKNRKEAKKKGWRKGDRNTEVYLYMWWQSCFVCCDSLWGFWDW